MNGTNGTTIDWRRKLTSRKFWAALAEFVTMLIIALHGDQETATQVAALIMAGAAVIAYIIGEGLADAAGAGQALPGWMPPIEETEPPDGDGDLDE